MNANLPNRGGPVGADTLWGPAAVFVDLGPNVWIADTQNHRVLRFAGAETSATRVRRLRHVCATFSFL